MLIDQFGIYADLPEDEYHRDPFDGGSLSSSEARSLLDSPARFRWRKDHPEFSEVFDFGRAAHAHVLGVGAPIDVLEFDDWRKKDAQTARDESREAGRTPVLVKDWDVIQAMAAALREHPLACRLLAATGGVAEQSLFWPHSSGVTLRARIDWLPNRPERGRLVLVDYKTALSADPRTFGKSVASYGYHQQAEWYLDGLRTLWGVSDPAMVFVVQEKSAPYLVSVCELDEMAMAIAAERNKRAIEVYIECRESGVWPGYAPEVHSISLPRWATFNHEEEYGNEQF